MISQLLPVLVPCRVKRHSFSLPESAARYCCGIGGKFSPPVLYSGTEGECIRNHSAGTLVLLASPY